MGRALAEHVLRTHPNPIWHERANFLIQARVPRDEDVPEIWEQLWPRQVGPKLFELCCIPFFAHGLALGDQVETEEPEHVIARVVEHSGARTIRLWFGNTNDEESRSRVLDRVLADGGVFEE